MDNEKKELLAGEVQKYPLLYDKTNKQYKNRVLVIKHGRKSRKLSEWKVCFAFWNSNVM